MNKIFNEDCLITMKNEKELTLIPYGSHNGIVICCKNCGSEFEETAEGYYPPIKYESDKHNRECRRCLTELAAEEILRQPPVMVRSEHFTCSCGFVTDDSFKWSVHPLKCPLFED